jgi:hypothetical protein
MCFSRAWSRAACRPGCPGMGPLPCCAGSGLAMSWVRVGGGWLWIWLADLVGEVRRFGQRIAATGERIAAAVRESGTALAELFGIGGMLAGKILARVGSVHRFVSAAVFASYTGTAPIAVSSGDVVRHRLSRPGIGS